VPASPVASVTYSAEYVQEGRIVRVVRKISGRHGKEPAEAYDDLIAWYKAMAEDDVQFIALTPPSEEGGRD
jgi:hypothetical protein